jgi:Xaa-Pro dipeptidase
MQDLYPAHVAVLRERYEAAAAKLGFDAIVVGSGVLQYRWLDDQAHRFVASPHFLQWAPLEEHPGSTVVFRPGRRPALIVCAGEDYWHEPPVRPEPWVVAEFELHVVSAVADVATLLPGGMRTALLGPAEQWAALPPDAPRNPEALLHHLHYHRARKTGWEVACIRRAAAIAAPGHHAAEDAFRSGASEYEILMAFLAGCRRTEAELPYGVIVALGEHGATLHYQRRERQRESEAGGTRAPSLLIDAGCAWHGYACDITRTHAREDGEFARMVADLDELQHELCGMVRPGVAFPDLHRRTHRGIAELLGRWGLVRMAPEEMIAAGVTFAFFPHGLGHLLGLQVHDVGGQMADETGAALDAPADFPKLRFLRALEPGHVVTVEPGIYFIGSLLAGLKSGPHATSVDWESVARLRRYGGIRIEDDLLVTPEGSENLTRAALLR